MKVLVISASQRQQSQTAKVASVLAKRAQAHDFEAEHLDLQSLNLPFFNGDGEVINQHPQWPGIVAQIKAADAFIFATPEWNGMASPMLKNFLLALPGKIAAHKPALLVGVSGGINGVYPIAELRANAFKNNGIVPIPEHLIVRYASDVLNDPIPNSESDKMTHQRLELSLTMLAQYAQALQPVQQAYQALEWQPPGM